MAKSVVPGVQERLRSFVSAKGGGWDYVVYWKLNDEQRFIDWVGCCCIGASASSSSSSSSPRPDLFHHQYLDGATAGPCPDAYLHSATKTCSLLSNMMLTLPMALESPAIQAQVLLSGQPRWINFSSGSSHDGVQTKVFIPIQSGVVELGSSNQLPENAMVIQSVRSKCGDSWQEFQHLQQQEEQQQHQHHRFFKSPSEDHFGEWNTPPLAMDIAAAHGWDHDVSLDSQFSLAPAQQLNFLMHQQHKPAAADSSSSKSFSALHHHQELVVTSSNNAQQQQQQQQPFSSETSGLSKENTNASNANNSSEVKQETRADSSDCSDQVDDDDDKGTGRSGRRHLSKNLVAERKRRKKLNERLYSLRALVPKITKMDRASILGDAIEYVKELQQQVKELQDELEEETQGCATVAPLGLSDLTGGTHLHPIHHHHHLDSIHLATPTFGVDNSGGSHKPDDDKKLDELAQPMQVEVSKMDTHLFTLRIFCEKRPGVYLKLMQAMDALGLDVLHANITTFRGLVLNVFNAEIRDKEMMQPEQVKETLLEMTCQSESRTSDPHTGVITIDG